MCPKIRVRRGFTPTTTQFDPAKQPSPNTLAQDLSAEPAGIRNSWANAEIGYQMNPNKLLVQIISLLEDHSEVRWAAAFRNLLAEYRSNPTRAIGMIRANYGGMGSFNDLVIHGSEGTPLREANCTLTQLRTALFASCQL